MQQGSRHRPELVARSYSCPSVRLAVQGKSPNTQGLCRAGHLEAPKPPQRVRALLWTTAGQARHRCTTRYSIEHAGGDLMNVSPSEVVVIGSVFLFLIWVVSFT